ncbi:hypothetical protein B0T17DRAFT_618092 [Bombardia bombarda]|uniref:Uncharacterized protein n=1 Tax=Bombardia bombarda TaxID=252184 RepID=A0AA39WU93_9PEZI|nr:hypothetical protein B0T17DRAFT_618092 [Bombardia bombarda]
MGWAWNGNATLTIVIITLVICFSWVPIITVMSLYQHGRARIRAFFAARGWVAPIKEEEKVTQHPKMPEIQKPPPIFNNGLARERSMLTRTYGSSMLTNDPLRRWDTGLSWDPIRRYDAASVLSEGPMAARNNSLRSNFSRPMQMAPMPSRASSIRSVSTQGRSRRPSVSSMVGRPPGAFQINTAYYDTTPLPTTSLNIANIGTSGAKSFSAKPPQAAGSQGRRGASFDQPGSINNHRSEREAEEASFCSDPAAQDLPSAARRSPAAQSHGRRRGTSFEQPRHVNTAVEEESSPPMPSNEYTVPMRESSQGVTRSQHHFRDVSYEQARIVNIAGRATEEQTSSSPSTPPVPPTPSSVEDATQGHMSRSPRATAGGSQSRSRAGSSSDHRSRSRSNHSRGREAAEEEGYWPPPPMPGAADRSGTPPAMRRSPARRGSMPHSLPQEQQPERQPSWLDQPHAM